MGLSCFIFLIVYMTQSGGAPALRMGNYLVEIPHKAVGAVSVCVCVCGDTAPSQTLVRGLRMCVEIVCMALSEGSVRAITNILQVRSPHIRFFLYVLVPFSFSFIPRVCFTYFGSAKRACAGRMPTNRTGVLEEARRYKGKEGGV